MLFDAGFAGIFVPKEYGGAGLTPAHQRGVQRGDRRLRLPGACSGAQRSRRALAVILDFGTEEQKLRHIPPILKGERVSGCSSCPSRAAGPTSPARRPRPCATATSGCSTARRSGRTGAWWADWGLCLARTNWDVPKHRGLTVFILPIAPAGHRGPPHRDAQRLQASSARSSSPTCASPTPTGSVTSTRAGPSASGGCSTSGARHVAAPHPPAGKRRGRDRSRHLAHPGGPRGRTPRRSGRPRHDRRGSGRLARRERSRCSASARRFAPGT